MRPLQQFLQTETSGGFLLLVAAIAALVWVNVPGGDSYNEFWDARVVLDFNVIRLDESLRQWVNDALMAIFFFVVGMEIKRELLRGELSDMRSAALPVAAAAGGMVVPALIYFAFNTSGQEADGWGIPMATDIAFAVGVLSLLGTRVPLSLKVFLLALAIVDDIGAITVIAVFYTSDLDVAWLAAAAGMFALVAVLTRLGVRLAVVYMVLGVGAWLCVFESGVHATIAGVIMGLLMPVNPHFSREEFDTSVAALMTDISPDNAQTVHDDDEDRRAALRELEELARDSRPVLDRLEHALHPWTSFAIIPIFALANAGVELSGDAISDAASSPIALGVAAGLVIGKPVGILLASFVAVRLGIAALPPGITWPQIASVGMIAGIGFTVSIFISELAFENREFVDDAKIGILVGSALIATAGFFALRVLSPAPAAELAPTEEGT